ncbi:MAG: phospholipase D family protein, partial [Deltaproteobacteria bacterium]|nr:phospholipase D family protein [Deltaproteobacteria bacterium]
MTPIAQKIFCPAKNTWLLWIVLRTFLVGMFIMYSGCAPLQPVNLQDEKALAPAKNELWTALAAERSDNWFKLLNTGDEAMEWRLRVIDSATRSLDLQTFLWKEDPTGLQILRHIFEAADRGVRVRLLLDDTFTVGQNDTIFDIDQHPNIEYRIYNPFERRYDSLFLRQLMSLGEFSRLDHRMHNKVMVADNRVAIIGGRNLADEYFGDHSIANFRDMEVLFAGPIIKFVSYRFDDYWNSNWSFPVDRILDLPPTEKKPAAMMAWLKKKTVHGLEENHKTRRNMWLSAARSGALGEAILLSDEPAQKHPEAENELPNQLAHALVTWIDRANEELILVSAYLIPTPELEGAIERAENRGVRVRILTNSLRSNNHTAAHSAYRHHVQRLIGHGADLHEVRAMAKDRAIYMLDPVDNKDLGLHAKLLLIDQEYT